MEIFETRTIVEHILPSEKSKSEQESDFKLFITHFKLILEHHEIILNRTEYFYILIEQAHVGTTISGIAYIPIGVLLLLWKDDKLLCTCPQCNEKSYVFQAGGSPLSGSHTYSAICPECEKSFCGRASSFYTIYSPIYSKLNRYSNIRTIIRKRTQKFSWKSGLVGQPTPDEILDNGIPTVEFKSLIAKLKEKERKMKE